MSVVLNSPRSTPRPRWCGRRRERVARRRFVPPIVHVIVLGRHPGRPYDWHRDGE